MPNASRGRHRRRRPDGRAALEAHHVLRLRQRRHPRGFAGRWLPRMRSTWRSNPSQKVRLEGHADERGSREYNIGLGERRGQTVRRALLLQGVAEVQLSHGELRRGTSGGRRQRRAGLCAQSPRRNRVPQVSGQCEVGHESSPAGRRRGDAARSAGCAVSPEEDPVQIRMNDLDTRLQRIERVMTNQSLLRDGATHRRVAGGAAHHARRGRAAAEPERRRQGAESQPVRRSREAHRRARDARRRRRGARRPRVRQRAAARRRAAAAGGEQASLRRGVQRAQGRATIRRAIAGFTQLRGHLSRQPAGRAMRSTGSARPTT